MSLTMGSEKMWRLPAACKLLVFQIYSSAGFPMFTLSTLINTLFRSFSCADGWVVKICRGLNYIQNNFNNLVVRHATVDIFYE